ncbi:MAG: FeoA family protein [Anaerolineae bacterium]
MKHGLVRLSELATERRATVVRIEGGRGFVARMSALGFTPGAELIVRSNPGHGPLIVSILDTQIALGRGQAAHVLVRPK